MKTQKFIKCEAYDWKVKEKSKCKLRFLKNEN